ncbi:hypothetical protein L1887_19203 [Cichorium endivia]|nr:hypothetical protein L1887_19203 [Cichorium endivia]
MLFHCERNKMTTVDEIAPIIEEFGRMIVKIWMKIPLFLKTYGDAMILVFMDKSTPGFSELAALEVRSSVDWVLAYRRSKIPLVLTARKWIWFLALKYTGISASHVYYIFSYIN